MRERAPANRMDEGPSRAVARPAAAATHARLLGLHALAGNEAVGCLVQRMDRQRPAKRKAEEVSTDEPKAEEPVEDPVHYYRDPDTIREVVELLSNAGWAVLGSVASSQGAKVHSVGMATAQLPATKKLRTLYEGKPQYVGRRSYKGWRNKEVLRWISTLTYSYLVHVKKLEKAVIQEVQAAFTDDGVLLATNIDKTNAILASAAGSMKLDAFVRHMLDATKNPVNLVPGRGERHFGRLESWLANPKFGVKAALPKPVRVVGALPKADEGLHAERRIARHLGVEHLDPKRLGGLRRPCLFCFLHLFPGVKDVHPGPMWTSGAATIIRKDRKSPELSAKELADLIIKHVPHTYVTSTASGPNTNADSESDSDYGAMESDAD